MEVLKQRFHTESGGTPVLRLLHDDALDYLKREARDWSEWKLVANLPYSVASPILVELAQAERGPQRMVATLQIEVAKRLMAEPGNAGLRRAHAAGPARLRTAGLVQDSGQLLLPGAGRGFGLRLPGAPRSSRCCRTEQRGVFVRIVKRSFSQRRKMMLKLLKQDWPEQRLAREFERLKLSPQIRAEEVSLEQFAQIAQALFTESANEGRDLRCRQRARRGHRATAAQRGASPGLDAPGGACAGVQRGRAGLPAKAVDEEGPAARLVGFVRLRPCGWRRGL